MTITLTHSGKWKKYHHVREFGVPSRTRPDGEVILWDVPLPEARTGRAEVLHPHEGLKAGVCLSQADQGRGALQRRAGRDEVHL